MNRSGLAAWTGPICAGVAALAVFLAALQLVDSGPGGGMGGDVVAGAVQFRPTHAPGHPLHLVLAKAATLAPLGTLAFRLRVLSCLCLGLAAAFIAAAAARLARVASGGGGPAEDLVGLGAGVCAGLSGPALATIASADVYALQALLGAALVWAALGAVLPEGRDGRFVAGRLLLGSLLLGLLVSGHAPSGLQLVPPYLLAAALALSRLPRSAGAGGESLLAARLSWVAALFAVGLLAVLALPLRAESLADAGTLLTHLLSRSPVAAMEADAAPAAWQPGASTGGLLVAALGTLPFVVCLLALLAAAFLRASRFAAALLAAFLLGPALVRSGTGIDRAPAEVAAYLAVPAFVLALALALPAGLALRAARRDGHWRRTVGWAALLVLAAAALIRHQVRRIDLDAAALEARALVVTVDALAEPAPPAAILVLARAPTAALFRYDETVFQRRPDLEVLAVPRLPEPDYARERMRASGGLAPLVSAYLGPADLPRTLADAVSRLAAQRPLFVEPGRLTRRVADRHLLPHGLLMQVLGEAAGRTDLAALLARAARSPVPLDGRFAGLRGTAAGGAVAWSLAQAAVVAAKAGALLPRETEAGGPGPREPVLQWAVRLMREAGRAGAPPGIVERFLAAVGVPGDLDPQRLDAVLKP